MREQVGKNSNPRATKPSAARRLWKFLSSVKLGVILLALVTISAIVGTVVESATDTASAQRWVYHSLWFAALMALTLLNLVLATWQTTTRSLRVPWDRPLREGREAFADLPEVREINRAVSATEAERTLSRRVGRTTGGEGALFAQRGILQRWGAIVTHLGIVLLLVGGIALSLYANFGGGAGSKMVWIGEGMSRDWFLAPDEENPQLSVREELPFQIWLHDFDADYFPHTEIPQRFTSFIELRDANGHSSMHRVNMTEALRWRGWKLSQSSFVMLDDSLQPGMAGFLQRIDGPGFMNLLRQGRMAIQLTETLTDTPLPVFDAAPGTIVPVPRRDFFFETPDGRSYRLLRGATVLAEGTLHHTHSQTGADVESGASEELYRAEVVGTMPGAYSGLAVMREPKAVKSYFYFSFLLFLLGPFLAFCLSHVRVWVWTDPETGHTLIGGRARGRRARLAKILDRIADDLQEVKA